MTSWPRARRASSVRAMERAFGVEIDPMVSLLRRLIYCGEWIESHVLHVAMLHAPDFLGYQDAIAMAADHREVVETALRLKKLGNTIMTVLGGREIHPVNFKVGGFYRVPSKSELAPLVDELDWAVGAAEELTRLVAGFDFPDFERDYEFVAMRHPKEYAIFDGRLVSSRGLDIDIDDYEKHFTEEHVKHSSALHSFINERGAYLTGPIARFNLNFDRLPDRVTSLAEELSFTPPCRNPLFH